MNAIELRGLCKTYPGFTMKDLDLDLPEGSIMGLVGENGAGKSTLIRIMLGMTRAESGTVNILGESDLRAHPAAKEDVGVVMDDVSLPAYLTVIEIGKIMAKIYSGWDDSRFTEIIRTLRIPEDKKFSELSRGNRMKAGFACALSHHPKLLLLDEATSGLDPVIRDELLDILLDFTREENHTILISSHIVSDLEKVCDYICFLHEGRIILIEEKDRIRDVYGRIQTSAQELEKFPPEAVIGRRVSPYGCEAIIRKDLLPDLETMPVDIEELFVFMVKGEMR